MPGVPGLDFGPPDVLDEDQTRLNALKTQAASGEFDRLTDGVLEAALKPHVEAAARDQFDALTDGIVQDAVKPHIEAAAQQQFDSLTQPHIDDALADHAAPANDESAAPDAALYEQQGMQAPNTAQQMAATAAQYSHTPPPSSDLPAANIPTGGPGRVAATANDTTAGPLPTTPPSPTSAPVAADTAVPQPDATTTGTSESPDVVTSGVQAGGPGLMSTMANEPISADPTQTPEDVAQRAADAAKQAATGIATFPQRSSDQAFGAFQTAAGYDPTTGQGIDDPVRQALAAGQFAGTVAAPVAAVSSQAAGEVARNLGAPEPVAFGAELAAGAPDVVAKVPQLIDRALPIAEQAGARLASEYGPQTTEAMSQALQRVPDLPIPLAGKVKVVTPRESVGEAIDRIGTMLADGRPEAAGPPSEIENAVTNLGTKLYQLAWASERPLQKAQQLVYERLGRAPTPAENAVLQMRLFAGTNAAAAERLTADLAPALRTLSAPEEGLLERWLVAADNAEKAASVGRRVQLDALDKAGQGLVEQAQALPKATAAGQRAAENRLFSGDVHAHPMDAIRQEFVSRYGADTTQKVEQAAQSISSYVSDLRERMYQADLIPADVYQEWKTNSPSYIPAKILRYLPESGPATVPSGRSLMTISDLGIKRLSDEGTTAARERPIDSLVRMTFAVENQIARQRGAQALEAMRTNSPELQGLMKPVLTFREAKAQGLKAGEFAPTSYKLDVNGETKFSVFKDGVAQEYVVPKWMEPLFRADATTLPPLLNTAADILKVASGTPLLKAGATTLNAQFVPVNAVRDAIQFLVRSDLRKLPTTVPALVHAYWDTSGAAVPGAIAGAVAGGQTADPNAPWWEKALRTGAGAALGAAAGYGAAKLLPGRSAADLSEMVKAGGGQSSPYFGQSPEVIRRALLREGALGGRIRPIVTATTKDTAQSVAGILGDVVTLLTSPVRAAGEAVEQAPRLAAYRLAKQAGLSQQEAALAARDITIDFARGGEASKLINRFVPFFNVAMQSGERAITYDWRRGNRAAAGVGVAAGLAASLAAEAWNRTNYPADYKDVPDYLKWSGITIITPIQLPPKADGTPRGHLPIWIPIPNEYQLLKGITNEGVARIMGDTPRTWQQIGERVLSAASPVGTEVVPLPPVGTISHDVSANYDSFRGAPIIPDKYRNLPPAEQYDPTRTSAAGRVIGRALNVSPMNVDYAVRTGAAGLGGQALEASNTLARAVGAPSPPPDRTGTAADVPVVGGIVGRFARTTAGGQTQEDARQGLDAEQRTMVDDQLAKLHASRSYELARPEVKSLMDRKVADLVAASFNKRRTALSVAARTRPPGGSR